MFTKLSGNCWLLSYIHHQNLLYHHDKIKTISAYVAKPLKSPFDLRWLRGSDKHKNKPQGKLRNIEYGRGRLNICTMQ